MYSRTFKSGSVKNKSYLSGTSYLIGCVEFQYDFLPVYGSPYPYRLSQSKDAGKRRLRPGPADRQCLLFRSIPDAPVIIKKGTSFPALSFRVHIK